MEYRTKRGNNLESFNEREEFMASENINELQEKSNEIVNIDSSDSDLKIKNQSD